MKIAVPTNDGLNISEHFGKSAGFLIFDVQQGQVVSCELKDNATPHTHEASGAHNCGDVVSALVGCEVVICGGMGARAAEALKQRGIGQVVLTTPGIAKEKVAAFLAGELAASAAPFCRCSH